MKVATEVVNKAEVLIKGNKDFIKHQDAHLKVLTRAQSEKLKQKAEVRKKRSVSVIVYRNKDPRNFEVHRNFNFGDFGVTEWDKLSVIIPKKKNKVVS
ncbi:hypothetical protein Tco_1363366 [Tanacetum coccineum]